MRTYAKSTTRKSKMEKMLFKMANEKWSKSFLSLPFVHWLYVLHMQISNTICFLPATEHRKIWPKKKEKLLAFELTKAIFSDIL